MPKKNRMNRRSYLKSLSAIGGAGMLSSPVLARQEPGFKRIIEQSLQVKESTNSIEKWHSFLENHGIDVQSRAQRYNLPGKSGGDVGTQHWYPEELDVTITISAPGCTGDEYYADLSWSYINDTSDSHVGGEYPYDIAGLYWNSDWWDLTSTDTNQSLTASSNVWYRDGTFSGDGPAFNVDDPAIYAADETDIWYCGAYLVPLGNYTASERRVYGEYTHTWSNVSITGVSVSYPPGLSVSLSNETYKWNTDTEDDGSTLLYVHQNDAYC